LKYIIFLLLIFSFLHAETLERKKERFFKTMVPIVTKVYNGLYKEFEIVRHDVNTQQHQERIAILKKYYNAKSDKELLIALKPHPCSITLAQAAIESAWGTSRFFKEANNIFGMWSSKSSQKRIAAAHKRKGRTIWLRKFDSLEGSVRAYYYLLSKARAYRYFKRLNYKSNNVYVIIKGLRNYSERKDAYVRSLAQVIKHNNLTQYDTKVAK
jgi:Bax protein